MKLFLDSANYDEIQQAAEWGVIDGVTTNPSLIASEGQPFHKAIEQIAAIVDGPISAEVVSTDVDGMLEEGRELAGIHENVVVKCPLTPAGLQATRTLASEGIDVNVTLCFSAPQALLAAKAGARFISPFVGRQDDIGGDGMELVREIVQVYTNYGFETEVLVASVRHPRHVLEATLLGADVATLPFGTLEKLFDHPLTDRGLDKFLADWEKGQQG